MFISYRTGVDQRVMLGDNRLFKVEGEGDVKFISLFEKYCCF